MAKHDVQQSSGNVFADIGLRDGEEMQLKSGMVIELRRLMEAQKLTQTATAKMIGLSQADLSKLLRGRFHGFSLERLKMLTAFNQDIEIVIRPHPKAGEAGKVSLNAPAI